MRHAHRLHSFLMPCLPISIVVSIISRCANAACPPVTLFLDAMPPYINSCVHYIPLCQCGMPTGNTLVFQCRPVSGSPGWRDHSPFVRPICRVVFSSLSYRQTQTNVQQTRPPRNSHLTCHKAREITAQHITEHTAAKMCAHCTCFSVHICWNSQVYVIVLLFKKGTKSHILI